MVTIKKIKTDDITINLISYSIISVIALLTVLPFIMLVSGSVQSETTILKFGFSLWPREFTGEAYKYIFANPDKILASYRVTIFVTVVGTSLSLFLSAMSAYVLYRKDLKYRNKLAFFLYFTTLFNGGLIPYYILIVRYLKMRDTISILILSGLFSVMYILILRNFISASIPDSLSESAKVDGANDFKIFIKIILPLMKPALASIGLFIALNYWNNWWTGMMFIENEKMMPLQYLLYRMLSKVNFVSEMLSRSGIGISISLPRETLKLAMTVVATGPIVILYPLVQRYFIKGITIGAVKG